MWILVQLARLLRRGCAAALSVYVGKLAIRLLFRGHLDRKCGLLVRMRYYRECVTTKAGL